MKLSLIIVLLLVFSPSVACASVLNESQNTSQYNDSVSFAGINYSMLSPTKEVNISEPIPDQEGQEFSEADNFDESDAGSDMVASGIMKGFTWAADDIYDNFGWLRGSIYSFITYNINPENIPVAKEYNNANTTMAVILAVLFIIGESFFSSLAAANYPAYRNVFGEKDFSQQKYAGGGISVIAGLGASWAFRAFMILINLIDAWMMLSVMEAIKPSLDNGLMYFAMAILEVLLAVFFFYRQLVICAMYIASPIYGVMWASGYFKEFVDSIGDKVLRALIMQPLCIFITTVSIMVMKVMNLEMFGITVWSADNSFVFYIILLAILLYTCFWCLFSKMTLVKRTGSMLVKKAVYSL